jgi:methylmalonyl-CoA mutase
LKAAGAKQLYLAGRPGDLEADLTAAGVDGFLYAGNDITETLSQFLAFLGA